MNSDRRSAYHLTLAAVLITLILCTCTEFSSQYERIETDRVRLLDFIYEPPEAAPGDTVLLKALFAGKEISSDDITWNVSYQIGMNSLGVDTVFDKQPLEYISHRCSFSEHTSCIALTFVIPDDCIKKSPLATDVFQLYFNDDAPLETDANQSYQKDLLLDLVDSLSHMAVHTNTEFRDMATSIISSQMPGDMMPLLLQLFSAKIRIYADVENSSPIQSDYAVNYHSRFSDLPGIRHSANRNPVIDSIGLYVTKGADLQTLDRKADNTTYRTLIKNGESSVISIEAKKGYSYFLEVFINNRDSVITLTDIENHDPASWEEITAQWFFQMNEEEMSYYHSSDLMNIYPLNDLTAVLYLPQKEDIRHFTIWAQVNDSKINVLNRSQGSSVVEFSGTFNYHY